MEPSGFKIRKVSKEQLRDDEFRKKCHEKYKHFTKMRSIVIDTALDIEQRLSIVILHFLVGTDYSRHHLLREFIFDAEFCSFMQKRKMLSMMFEMFPSLSKVLPTKESQDLRRQINDFILNRDMFTHGNIFIDAENDKVIMQYYRGGKKETEISQDIISEILKSSKFIKDKLHILNEYLRENRLDVSKEES